MRSALISLLLLWSGVWQALTAKENIALSLDVAQFRNADGQSYMEIYFSIPEKGPKYVADNSGFRCDVVMSMEILHSDTLWASKTWRISNRMADTLNRDMNKQLVDLLRYPIVPGDTYHLVLFARDLQKSQVDSISMDFASHTYPLQKPLLSDLQLANAIMPYDSSCAESFHKRFYCVIPNPEITFGGQNTDLYFYYEAYDLQRTLAVNTFRVQARILDIQGKPFEAATPILHERDLRQNMIREIGQFSVKDFPSGVYRLEYAISDSNDTVITSNTKVFLVRNPGVVQAVAELERPKFHFLDGFDLKRLDEEFDKLFAVTQKQDREIYRSLKEVEGKRNFLYSFWDSHKPTEMAAVEDYRNYYLHNCQYVNTNYSRTGKAGWRTDRGMIYLRYGKPSDIERHTVGKETKPYEIWYYENIENGVQFVFADRTGFNQYELIHSTKKGEVYNPDYQMLLRPSGGESFKM